MKPRETNDTADSGFELPGEMPEQTQPDGIKTKEQQCKETDMQINVKIQTIYPTGRLKARLTANLNEQFAIRGLRLVEGNNGLFVDFPAYKGENGSYIDHCFPCTSEFRSEFTAAVVEAYYEALQGMQPCESATEEETM